MILLTTPSLRAQECAVAIEAETGQETRIAGSLQQAVSHLRNDEYSAVILDEGLLEADPAQAEVVLQQTGLAIVLTVNCGIAGPERIVRELRSRLRCYRKELEAARESTEQNLRTALRDPLTALLLECELALALPSMPPGGRDKLRNIHDLARNMEERLKIAE